MTGDPSSRDRLGDYSADRRTLLLTSMAAAVGVMSAFVALALVRLIGLFTNLAYFHRFATSLTAPAASGLGLWAVPIPAIGGVIVGLMARYGSDRIRGHGIPEALEAILIGRSRMDPKVAVLKPLSSAIAIGTGGPYGAEGPIIVTGGAFGSLFAQAFHLSPVERKTLLVAGAAGGMTAIFATPVAAVLLAIELLLFEFKPRSFIPVACASAVAGVLRVPLFGAGPLFPVTLHATLPWTTLVTSLGVGLAAGLGATAVTALLYGCEDLFARLPIHWMWWPAIGGVFVGLGGLIAPRALGVGYDVIHDLLAGRLLGATLVALLLVKAAIWAIGLGSGTSGGLVAPLLLMGSALGALGATVFHAADPGLWAMIGMAALMGGTMQIPVTAIVFALELTGDVAALPALLIACVASEAVTLLVLRRSILTEKLARRGRHLTRDYGVNPLRVLQVEDVMEPPLVAPAAPDVVTYPDELLEKAMSKLLEHELEGLPVASRDDPTRVVGYVERAAILAAWVQLTRDEHTIEEGWLGRLRRAPR
ncbi:MAG TPA: chloride channel protein [Gemmatimonadales bacterium]|nr:chloride channel protein [Gemmatimonadales bacterium]